MALLTLTAAAKPVDRATAQRVAANFWNAHRDNGVAAVTTMNVVASPFDGMFIFSAGENGFVIVSADDCAKPILGYSFYNNAPEIRTLNGFGPYIQVREWLASYQEQIELIRKNSLPPTDDIAAQWALYSTGSQIEPEPLTAVAPLITTTWNQAPYYNDLCPYDANEDAYYNHRVVTGCVATATSQIMKKWNHPTNGYGSHSYVEDNYGTLSANFGSTTYQWNNMPTALTSTSSNAQRTAVATLMYHVGVAVEMDYDLADNGGSGASNYNYFGQVGTSSETALQRYFKYRPDMGLLWSEDYSESQYSSLLQAELNQGRPILYSGRNTTGGHSFVCDGYNNAGQFHFNWGWGGSYDGYFTLGSLNPGVGGIGGNSSGTYNMNNAALIGIRPNTSWSATANTYVTASTVSGGSVTGTGTYSYGDTVDLIATANTGYRFDGWSDGTKFNPREFLANGGNYNFTPVFTPITGDTISYCSGNRYLSSYGAPSGTTYWGIKIPAAQIPSGESLSAVQLYVAEAGTYTLTIYTGANRSNTAASGSINFGSDDEGQWQTLYLNNPVSTTEDLWIIFSCSDVSWPAPASYYGGVANSFLLSIAGMSYLTDYSSTYGISAMIKAIFGSGSTPNPPTPTNPCLITSFPYTENFDDTSTYSCLYLTDANGDGQSWGIIDSFGTNYSHAAYIMYAEEADDYLILPGITTPGNYTLTWKACAYDAGYPETYQVYAGNTMIFNETITATTLTTKTATFSVAAGDTVNIKFRYISDDMYAFFIDDVTITSNSTPTQYTITVQSANTTMGTVSGGGTYNAGSNVTISATANTGYHFTQWNDGNANATRTITVTGNATYTAFFEADAPTQYTITVQSANTTMGTVSGGGTYNAGSNVTISATANTGYHFTNWNDGNTNATRTITVTGNATYTAFFEANAPTPTSDTISWCGNGEYNSTIGTGTPGSMYWGISLTPTVLSGHNYLKSVMLFVANPGTYILDIYTGGTTAPGTIAHSQTAIFTESQLGWQEILLDATFTINQSQYLWITFHSTDVDYPAAGCDYVNNTNSDWASTDGITWGHIQQLASTLVYSWLIKAVTTNTQPPLPAPTIHISGQQQLAMGLAYTFSATASQGAAISWSLPGATPSTATGSSITASYSASGLYNVIATATGSTGSGHDTMQVLVVNYGVGDTISYALNRGFYTNVGTGDNGSFSWGIKLPTSFLNGRTHISKVLVGVAEIGSYSVRIYQGGENAPQTLIHTGTLNVTAADTSNVYTTYTPSSNINISSTSNLWVVIHADNLGYPARSCVHTTDTNSDWTSLDDTEWHHLPDLGVNASWMIKVVAASSLPTYTITVQSANTTLGSATGSGSYTAGSNVTISATANAGYHFTQWNDGNTNATRTITVTGNATYTAFFEADAPTQYTITVLSANTTMGTVSGGGTFDEGSTITITATPNSGYHFTQWSDGNTNASRTVTVTGNATYTAYFEANAPNQYTITVLSNNAAWGTVSGGGTYAAGSTATISATANSGYHFVQWNDGNTNATRTVSVNSDATYIATFEADAPVQYTITVVSANTTMGTVSGSGTYNAGSTVTITATANNGYHFVQWNDGNTNAIRTITVTGNATYVATFEANQTQQYTITVLANNDSWGNVTGGGRYDASSSVTINAMPYSGYRFVQWNDGNENASRSITVTADATYIATFEPVTGIDEADGESWVLYPNPATDAVTIVGVSQATVTINDLTGRTIAVHNVAEGNRTIDVSNLAAGAYFLHITSDGISAVRKLIKK